MDVSIAPFEMKTAEDTVIISQEHSGDGQHIAITLREIPLFIELLQEAEAELKEAANKIEERWLPS